MPLGAIPYENLALPVLIFLARVTDVSIGTVRLICVTRGHRAVAVCLGFCEILIWVTAFSTVLRHLDHWINIVAFAGGFATGNAVGMAIEKRLAMGVQLINLVSRGSAHAVAAALRYIDIRVTTFMGNGDDGPVAVCMAVVPRRKTPTIIRIARNIDPDVLVTVEDVNACLPTPCVPRPGKTPSQLMSTLSRWTR